jgi:hypothetical protein
MAELKGLHGWRLFKTLCWPFDTSKQGRSGRHLSCRVYEIGAIEGELPWVAPPQSGLPTEEIDTLPRSSPLAPDPSWSRGM